MLVWGECLKSSAGTTGIQNAGACEGLLLKTRMHIRPKANFAIRVVAISFSLTLLHRSSAAQAQAIVDSINNICIQLAVLGGICGVCAWAGEACMKTTGLRQSAAWRRAYITAILRQDVGWYDVNKANELSSRVAESTRTIEEGISSKLSLGARFLFQGFTGIILAFIYKWDMALVCMACSPISAFGAWYISYATTEGQAKISEAYASAGGVASETLSEMRTVSALGVQGRQSDKYRSKLEMARRAGVVRSVKVGLANGMLFASGNIMMAVGFGYGGAMMAAELDRTKKTIQIPDANGVMTSMDINCAYVNYVKDNLIDACNFNGANIMIAMFCIE
jgi:ABC-type multidrug transport system fused ATPase/permease subunit